MKTIALLLFVFGFSWASAQDKNLSAEKLYEQGEVAHNEGRYAEALSLLNACLQKNPAYAEAYKTRGAVKEELKDREGALTDYSIYVELKPEDSEVLFNRALVRYKLGKYEQAKEDLHKLLTLSPGETNTIYYQKSASASGSRQIMTAQGTLKPQILNYLGLTETKLTNYKSAIHWFDSALYFEPREADYYVNRGIAKEGMNDTTAFSDYKKAISINPNHTVALHNIAVLKRKQGIKSQGDDLEKAIESDSSMLYPYLERAYQRLEGGYYKGALEDYTQALRIEKEDPDIWLNRGLVKEKLNDEKGAYSDYSKAISLKDDYPKAWLNRGNVLHKLGKDKEAIKDYTAALSYDPDFASAYYNRAIANEKLKQYAEACADLKRAENLGLLPDDKLKAKVCPD